VGIEPNPRDPRRQAHEDFVRRAALVTRREKLDAATVEAFSAFRRSGVDAILLKGAALAGALYRLGEPRGYFDIDVLVGPAQHAKAEAILTELGYRSFSEVRGVNDIGRALHADIWLGAMVGFHRGFAGVMIDLHRRLEGCRAPDALVWEALSGDRSSVEVAGTAVPTLGLPGMALSVALHVAQHGPGDAKAVGDLSRAVERWPLEVWREAASLAQDVGGEESFAAGLRLLPVGTELADELGLGSAERVLWDLANRDLRPRGTFHLEALTSSRSAREKLDVGRRALLPTRAWIRWEMPWATRSGVHLALAYVLHVVRTPVWGVRAIRYSRRRPITSGE
jgi:hypothetical protein